ncbi:hypothetical protein ABFS83_06G091800 [Erythranthe nasuta]
MFTEVELALWGKNLQEKKIMICVWCVLSLSSLSQSDHHCCFSLYLFSLSKLTFEKVNYQKYPYWSSPVKALGKNFCQSVYQRQRKKELQVLRFFSSVHRSKM